MTEIKQAQKTDLTLISELEKQCFNEPWTEKTLSYFHENGSYIAICYLESSPVGYAVLDLATPDFAEIMRIAVLPESRGKGYADGIMRSVTDRARECKKDKILLEVRESNSPAISLYKKFGFKDDGIRKNYYKNPDDDAVIMLKASRQDLIN